MKVPPERKDAVRERRKSRDMARCLPLLGVFLLVSPLLNALIGIETVLGAPVAYVYIFSAWALLILLTWGVNRKLMRETQDRAER